MYVNCAFLNHRALIEDVLSDCACQPPIETVEFSFMCTEHSLPVLFFNFPSIICLCHMHSQTNPRTDPVAIIRFE